MLRESGGNRFLNISSNFMLQLHIAPFIILPNPVLVVVYLPNQR